MKIGKLYQVKKYFWYLYPSKDIAVAARPATDNPAGELIAVASVSVAYAKYWSKELNCNVSYISPNSIFCLLEKDEKYCKILSTNGELGWIYLADWCKDDIEEVNR